MGAVKHKPRDYQEAFLDSIAAAFRRHRRVLGVLPTGGGKTICFTEMVRRTLEKAERLNTVRRVWVLAHRDELVNQASEKFDDARVRHGIIKGGNKNKRIYTAYVQVASVASLQRCLSELPAPDLIIIDEAHHAPAGMWADVLEQYPKAYVLGVTATPIRSDNVGLEGQFDVLIIPYVGGEPVTTRWLTDQGYLVDSVTYAPETDIDTSDLKKGRNGEYTRESLRIMSKRLTGNAVEHYKLRASGKPAIAFCVSVEDAKLVCADFRAAGYKAEVFADDIKTDERKRLLAGLANGSIHVLCACDMISEGTDVPVCTVAILMRHTMSLGLHLQQIGRVLRPVYAPGFDLSTKEGRLAAIAASEKPHAIILDMVGNVGFYAADGQIVLRHGYPDDEWDWQLEAKAPVRKSSEEINLRRAKSVCKSCAAHVMGYPPECPWCGAPMHHPPANVRVLPKTEGELKELQRQQAAEREEERKKVEKRCRSEAFKCESIEELMGVAQAYGKPAKWVQTLWPEVERWRDQKFGKPKEEQAPIPILASEPEPKQLTLEPVQEVDFWKIEGVKIAMSDCGKFAQGWKDGKLIGQMEVY